MSEKKKKPVKNGAFERWQKDTLASFAEVSKNAVAELRQILATEKNILHTIGPVTISDDSHERALLTRVINVLNMLIQPTEGVVTAVRDSPDDLTFDPWLSTETLYLSRRASNCLKNEGIHYLGQLVSLKEKEMLRIPNLGEKSLEEVKRAISSSVRAYLGMKHPTLDAVLRKHPLPGYLLG